MIPIPFYYSEQVLVGNGITCNSNGITSLTIFGIKHQIIIAHFFFSARLQNTITSCSTKKKTIVLANNCTHSTAMYFTFNSKSVESSY